MLEKVHLKVNGQIYGLDIEPDVPLIYILRNDLGLKGTKLGCGLGQCGACKIIIDGQAVSSCRISARSVQGKEITTIEGIGTADDLHPLQKAFIEEKVVQCGFCVSGMIVAAKALLDKNPRPTDAEIQAEMSGNLCRCGTYGRVMRAIKRASGRPHRSSPYEVVPEREGAHHHGTTQASPSQALLQTLAKTPDLDSWVRINSDETVTLFTGKVELGQDLRTSIAMIGADELDVSLKRIRVVMADTARSPDEGYTVSSMSLETSGNAIRYAAAEVRRLALLLSQEVLGAPAEGLEITDGTIIDLSSGRSVTYWDLFAGKSFSSPVLGGSQPKRPAAYRIVGRPAARLDLVEKVSGGPVFIHDLDLPGMVHGRAVRPPNYHAGLVSIDEKAVSQMPGVIRMVHDGSFLGVIAEREEQAVHAMEVLQKTSVWETGKALPEDETLFDQLLSQKDEAFLIVDGKAVDEEIPPIKEPSGAHQTLTATYYRPYHMHASLGPSAAVAIGSGKKLTIWTPSQGAYPLRGALSQVLRVSEGEIHVIHRDGPGCYGHNGADDAALDAALLARALPGRPVSLKWTRSDENAWEPYGPATVVKMQASLNKDGAIIDWNHDVWGYAHNSRPHADAGGSNLLAAQHLADPFPPTPYKPLLGFNGCVYRNAEPMYDLPRQRIVMHFLPESPLRVSALRGLGSYANVFALESFIDELAHAADADPVEFRLRHLIDPRACAVIEAAVDKAGSRPASMGRGVAFARYKNRQSYVAVVVDLEVNQRSGVIHLVRAVVAADAGQIVNPDALSNQLEGVFTQSASWTLKEQVSFGQKGITSLDWHHYPILQSSDAPEIETVLLDRPGRPFLGIGEGAQGPIPAAIANAVFDIAGIRLRKIPFTPGRVKAALRGQ